MFFQVKWWVFGIFKDCLVVFKYLIEKVYYRINLTKNIDKKLHSEAYSSRAKAGHQELFSSNSGLTIKNLIFIFKGFKTSVQRELDWFFKFTSDSEFNIRGVT